MARNWRRTRKPVRLEDITDAMLAGIQRSAAKSQLPQTVWPSKWFGPDGYVGVACLLTSSAMGLNRPSDAADGAEPLFTVLPPHYHQR
ncbi:hypothetical protein CLV30_12884 [Haloactinopolyspora alba]|uniref:Uncharacterized protein n=1 Tax=Haloactinopolyspora alba TaxID=648780 RepID=A0A2P8DF52_9ACTN|nr:hypothetical protein [Haloactinopolyspora alba]PSK95832.1 hypothetical protein CLV30_12884 [Haloactinopolyspora alba]